MKHLYTMAAIIVCIISFGGVESGRVSAGDLSYYADVYAWFPNGKVQKASPGDGIYLQACIHPYGTHLIYSGNKSGPPRVWITDLKTDRKVALTPEDSASRHPVFSWDGKKIVFTSDRNSGQKPQPVEKMKATGLPPKGATANIFIMNANGGNVKQITKGAYLDQRPAFSPDGKHIAFVSNRTSKWWRIFVIPADGSAEPRVLQTTGWGYRPWFSPDGRNIYFHTAVDNRHQIVKIPFEGGEVVPLTNDDTGKSRGAFVDPGGEVVLMHSTRSGDWGIWELPLNGSKPKRLQPPGYARALHPTRSKNGIVGFDAYRRSLDEDSLY